MRQASRALALFFFNSWVLHSLLIPVVPGKDQGFKPFASAKGSLGTHKTDEMTHACPSLHVIKVAVHNVVKGLFQCILLARVCNIKYSFNFDGLVPLTFSGIL